MSDPINFAAIRAALTQGLALVRALEPVASAGGPAAAQTAAIVGALAETAQNALARIDDAAVVVAAEDETAIRAILADLQAENDRLAAAIASG